MWMPATKFSTVFELFDSKSFYRESRDAHLSYASIRLKLTQPASSRPRREPTGLADAASRAPDRARGQDRPSGRVGEDGGRQIGPVGCESSFFPSCHAILPCRRADTDRAVCLVSFLVGGVELLSCRGDDGAGRADPGRVRPTSRAQAPPQSMIPASLASPLRRSESTTPSFPHQVSTVKVSI